MDWEKVNGFLVDLETGGRTFLTEAGIEESEISVARQSDMRYLGQGYEIKVPIPSGELTSKTVPNIEENFSDVYRTLYSRTIDNVPIEGVTWRVLSKGPSPEINLQHVLGPEKQSPLKGNRTVRFSELETPQECPVYNRYGLTAGDQIDGPAIIEEKESTFIIGPNSRSTVDEQLNIVVDLDIS